MGDIIVILILASLTAWIICSLIKKKRKGGCCAGECGSCGENGCCGRKAKDEHRN